MYTILIVAISASMWTMSVQQDVMTLQNKPCVFPFTWKAVEYTECTLVDSFPNWEWCGLAAEVKGYFDWGYCVDANNPPPPVAPPDITCSVQTMEGQDCAFPFEYNGQQYSSCTTENYDYLWCATEHTYTSNDWGLCSTAMTTDDIACSFPFEYNGVTYEACTDVNHPVAWCAYDSVYQSGRWGDCLVQTC